MIERVEHLPVPKSIMGIVSYRDWDRLAIEVRVRESVIIVNVVELINLADPPKLHSTHLIPLALPDDGVMSDSTAFSEGIVNTPPSRTQERARVTESDET